MIYFVEYKDQLLAFGIIPNVPGSKAKALADLKADMDEEKAAQVTAQVEADILSWAVHDLKVSADRFASQIPTLEGKVKHIEDKVVEGLKEVRAWELCLEHTTQANDNYQKEVAQFTKKLESKSPNQVWNVHYLWISSYCPHFD
jgi:predicted  nucleic acid-binding Zn-ribbon protein